MKKSRRTHKKTPATISSHLSLFSLSNPLWIDFFMAAGIISIFALLGYYAREFALLAQNNLFFLSFF